MSLFITKNILFKECVEALKNATILSREESDQLSKIFEATLPILEWGTIDWDKINRKKKIHNTAESIAYLEELLQNKLDPFIYILWSTASVPSIKTEIQSAINVIDDVTCVGPDTWFLNLDQGYVVEFFHEGEIRVGCLPDILTPKN